MFRRLVICISPSHNIFTPGLAIFFLATILEPNYVWGVHGHTCGVSAGLSNFLWCAGARWCMGWA